MTTPSATRRAFGQRMRRARLDSNLPQVEAARATGVSRQALCMWESGDRAMTVDHLIDLAQLYGVDAQALLFGEARRQINAADHDALLACLQPLPASQRDRIRAVLAVHLQRAEAPPPAVRTTPAHFWPFPHQQRVRRKSEAPKQRQLPEASIANQQTR